MPAPAVAATIASVGGGLLQANSEKKAANKAVAATTAASQAQIAEVQRQFDTVRGLLQPYVSAGNTGLNSMMALLGLGGGTTGGTPLGITTIPGTAGKALSGNDLAFAKSMGINTAGLNGLGTPETYQTADGRTFKTMAEAQAWANSNLQGGTTVSANDAQQAAIDQIKNGSQFNELTKQGEEAILANASATGGLRGGNTQGALAQFRPALLQSLIDKQLGYLSGLAGMGSSAAAGVGTAAQNTGQQVSSILGDAGAMTARGALAGGLSSSSAIAGITGSVNKLFGGLRPIWSGTGAAPEGYAAAGTSPAFGGLFGPNAF